MRKWIRKWLGITELKDMHQSTKESLTTRVRELEQAMREPKVNCYDRYEVPPKEKLVGALSLYLKALYDHLDLEVYLDREDDPMYYPQPATQIEVAKVRKRKPS